MGVSGDSHPGLLLLSHLAGVLGFAAGLWLYLEDLQLRRQLSELQEEVADIRAHSSNPRQRPAQSRGWDPAEPPPGTWTGKGLGSEGLLRQLFVIRGKTLVETWFRFPLWLFY